MADPVVNELDHVYYWTADMDRSVAFYRDVLGLRLIRREGESWAMFDASMPPMPNTGTGTERVISSMPLGPNARR